VKPIDSALGALTWRSRRRLFRIHRGAHGPWWFSADGTGRFDPVHVDGLGACYLAEEPLGAFVEVFRTRILLEESEIETRVLTQVQFGRDLWLADACAREALSYGVTAQLGADGDYSLAQDFASSAARAGFQGVRWCVRHDPAQQLAAIALFGPAGGPTRPRRWPRGSTRDIDARLIGSAAVFGYRVAPHP
jgi:hypothetical protein